MSKRKKVRFSQTLRVFADSLSALRSVESFDPTTYRLCRNKLGYRVVFGWFPKMTIVQPVHREGVKAKAMLVQPIYSNVDSISVFEASPHAVPHQRREALEFIKADLSWMDQE